MNIEQKLIVGLLGNARKSELTSLLEQEIDWKGFYKTATAHRVVPALFREVQEASVEFPLEVISSLRRRVKRMTMRNLEFAAELKKLSDILEENDIEFLSYKGLALAELAYGDPSLRSFGDLDIFIRKEDFQKAKKTIYENGGSSFWTLSKKQEQAVLKYYYEYPFRFGRRPLLVEIHWAFMESFFGFDYEKEDVFGRSQNVSLYGNEFQTLSNEDLFIILCVHGCKHYWKRLSWIYDIAKLIENQPIDWNLTISLAKKFGSSRMVFLGAHLADELFGVELPKPLKSLVKADKKVDLLASELQHQIFDDEISAEVIRSRTHLQMLDRWRDKFTYSQRLFRTKLIDSLFMPMGRPV